MSDPAVNPVFEAGKWLFSHVLTALGAGYGTHRYGKSSNAAHERRLTELEGAVEKEKLRVTAELVRINEHLKAGDLRVEDRHKETGKRLDHIEHTQEALGREIRASSDRTADLVIKAIQGR